MNTGYLIYQAERPRSRYEQQQADIASAELARTVSRCWHALTTPLRALRQRGRRSELPAGYWATERTATEHSTIEHNATEHGATEHGATDCLATERLATECLTGPAA
jgi:hypothetical protein